MEHEITGAEPNSIAFELVSEDEIAPGDILLSINGQKMQDVFDYRLLMQNEEILLEIEKPTGEIWEIEIEKDEDEDIGLLFENALMSKTRVCQNNCVFCFVAQQPEGLRPSLYVKDDDIRLSFLHGNYVTLTNLGMEEIRRVARLHLSPLKISVHAADIALRKKMMGSDKAENLFAALDIFAEAGIKMHFQVVLCKGFNDGENLDYTIQTLARQKGSESLAVVPAGITRHRENLTPLAQFSPAEARAVIAQINKYPQGFAYAADEWYIMADEPLPAYSYYKDFPQLDNGVGMLRLFERQFTTALKTADLTQPSQAKEIGIITGKAAANFMRKLTRQFPHIKVYEIKNNFFGESITVSGLLTGCDIIGQLQGGHTAEALFVAENAFRADTEEMLCGTTLPQLAIALNAPIIKGSADGGEFLRQIITQTKD